MSRAGVDDDLPATAHGIGNATNRRATAGDLVVEERDPTAPLEEAMCLSVSLFSQGLNTRFGIRDGFVGSVQRGRVGIPISQELDEPAPCHRGSVLGSTETGGRSLELVQFFRPRLSFEIQRELQSLDGRLVPRAGGSNGGGQEKRERQGGDEGRARTHRTTIRNSRPDHLR